MPSGGTQTVNRAIKAVSGGSLTFTPWTTFVGTISNVTVEKVGGPAPVPVGWTDSLGLRTAELRFGRYSQSNLFFGKFSGRYKHRRGQQRRARSAAMGSYVTGVFNGAAGVEALMENALTEFEHGSKNVALGIHAMRHTNGASDGSTQSNIALGIYALSRVTGSGNIGIPPRTRRRRPWAAKRCATSPGAQQCLRSQRAQGSAGCVHRARNAFGDNAGIAVTTGAENTLFGPAMALILTTGIRNILIWFGINPPAAGTSNYINIGNVIRGYINTGRMDISALSAESRLHTEAGTTGTPA